MPSTSREVRRRLGLDPDLATGSWNTIADDRYVGSLPVEKGDPLFPRIRTDT
jgi:hypothetical protein